MSSALTSPQLTFAASEAILAAYPAIAKTKLFSRNFSADAVQPGATMKVPIFDTDAATAWDDDSNNYGTNNGTVDWASVTFDTHVKKTFMFTDKDFLDVNLRFWGDSGRAAGISVSRAILNAVTTEVCTTTETTSLTTITKKNVAALRSVCAENSMDPAHTVLVLTPAAFAEALSLLDSNVYGGPEAVRSGIVPSLYGFKAITDCPGFPAGTDSTIGALVHEDAVVIAGRYIAPQGTACYDEIGMMSDDESGLVLGLRRFCKPETGWNYYTVEALLGAKLVQGDACVRILGA